MRWELVSIFRFYFMCKIVFTCSSFPLKCRFERVVVMCFLPFLHIVDVLRKWGNKWGIECLQTIRAIRNIYFYVWTRFHLVPPVKTNLDVWKNKGNWKNRNTEATIFTMTKTHEKLCMLCGHCLFSIRIIEILN